MKHEHEEQAVAVTRADGGVSIHRFYVTGRGTILPPGAQWVLPHFWRRSASDENIEASLAKAFSPGEITSWRRISQEEIPGREYRNAIVDRDGKLVHDMPKARTLKRDEIREARITALLALDGEWMRATGQRKGVDADAIEAKRQAWRDAPADSRIEMALNIDELKAIQLPE